MSTLKPSRDKLSTFIARFYFTTCIVCCYIDSQFTNFACAYTIVQFTPHTHDHLQHSKTNTPKTRSRLSKLIKGRYRVNSDFLSVFILFLVRNCKDNHTILDFLLDSRSCVGLNCLISSPLFPISTSLSVRPTAKVFKSNLHRPLLRFSAFSILLIFHMQSF